MNRQDLVDRYNDGDKDILKYFDNNKLVFLKYLRKKEYWDQLDYTIGPNNDYHDGEANSLLTALKSLDYELFLEKVLTQFDDVFFVNGKFYLITEDFHHFSKLFCERRNNIYFISTIISGEYDYSHDMINWSDIDVWRDVIEHLNEKNLDYLYKKIFTELKDIKIEPETEVLESLASQQGHPGYVDDSISNINELLEDDETKEYLFDNYLTDIESDLKTVYSSAYETAFYNEAHKEIWSELNRYFVNPIIDSRPHTFQKNTSVEFLKAEIVDFNGLIDLLLSKSDTSPEYYGSLITWMRDELPCLQFDSDFYSYPSMEEINDAFENYF